MFTGDGALTAFWVSFPDDPGFPLGLGVTAWSESDAARLLAEAGYDHHLRARRVEFRVVTNIEDIGLNHVRANAGSVVVRGVWYPCMNIGHGR